MAVTMARSLPLITLSRLDLPTLGLPTSATCGAEDGQVRQYVSVQQYSSSLEQAGLADVGLPNKRHLRAGGRAGQGRAGGRAGQGRAGQGRAGQGSGAQLNSRGAT